MPIFSSKKEDETKKKGSIEQWVTETYLQGVTSLRDIREDTKKWQNFVYGDMIDEDVKEKLKRKNMPALPLNIVLPKIIRVIGAERASRAPIKAIPLTRGKNDTAKALTRLFEQIRVNSDGHREIRRAFEDAIIGDCPGWLEVVWTNDNDPLGSPIYRRVNPLFVIWDIKGQRPDLSDTRWIMKTWFATKDDVVRDFPEKSREINGALEDLEKGNWSGIVSDWWEKSRGYTQSLDDQFIDRKENLFRLIECQKREEVTENRLYDSETQSVERPENKEELAALKEANPRLIEVDFKWDKIRVITTVAGSRLLLQDVDADVQNGMYSLIPMWGYTFGDRTFGMVRNLEGPQELYWKETSSALHSVNLTANPIWMIPKDSMTPQKLKELEQYSAAAGYILEYDPMQTGGKEPKREQINLAGVGQLNLAERGKIIADEVSGIGPNAVGMQDSSGESGELVKTRVGETLAMLELLFDNKMESLVLLHYYLIAVIQSKMTGMRITRWVSDGGSPEEVILNEITAHGILNDMKQGEYGISIEKGEAQYFRQEKFLKLVMLAKVVGPLPELIELIIKSFDDLDENEKENVIKAYKIQSVLPELQNLEQEVRGNIAENQKQLEAGRANEGAAQDKQLDAMEKMSV